MKKVGLTLLIALVFAFSANAQLKNKKGEVILPETGDWAIGINATPILDYFGNMLNNDANNNITWNFTNGQSIFGKYFTSETEAYRVGLRIGFVSQGVKNLVAKTGTTTAETVEDKATQSDMNIYLSAGKEFRKGHGRLQGFYGADAFLMFGTSSASFTYGNVIDGTNPTPVGTTWNTNPATKPIVSGAGALGIRPTKDKAGATFGFGVRAFIGAEYFVLPKLSIGGEFGWGLGLATTGKGLTTTEAWDGSAVKSTDVETGGSSKFAIDTDNFGGAIKVMFHF
jgi:hypothetical protein